MRKAKKRRHDRRDDAACALPACQLRSGGPRLGSGLAAGWTVGPDAHAAASRPRVFRRALQRRAPPRSRPAPYSPTISPSYMTRMRSESESTSSSSSETSRTARPASRSSTSRRWTYSIAPTSRPRVGCAAMSTCGSSRDLARDDDLLLVAAGERLAARLRPAAADVELLDQRRCALDQAARAAASRARVRRPVEVVERDVLGERELEHEPAPLAVLRDVADARRRGCARVLAPVSVLPADEMLPLSALRRPVSASTSSVWPLPSTPAIPTISPARTLEGHAAHGLEAAVVAARAGRRPRAALAGLGGRLLDAEQHVAADHQPREALPRSRPRAARSRSSCRGAAP